MTKFAIRSCLLICIVSLAFYIARSRFESSHHSTTESTLAAKPLPTFIITPQPWSLQDGNQLTIDDISASSLLLVNQTTGQILAQRNADQQRPMASLTKVMTAALALEFTQANSLVTVPAKALQGLPADSAMMGISAGEQYTIKELLYGLLLPSGNDAAQAIAMAVAGDQKRFVDLMNAKAQQLGMQHTHFTNPSGLDDQNHYSSAKDLVVLAHYAASFPLFQQIIATYQKELPYSLNHKYLSLINANAFITNYSGATGIKPGNTGEAGNCLLASATRNGHTLIGVLLDTPGRNTNMAKLFDKGFAALESK